MSSSMADLEIAAKTLFSKSYYTSRQKSPSFKESLQYINRYLEENTKVDSSREIILIILTDGEISNKEEKPEDVVAELNKTTKLIGGSLVISYGSDEGTFMPVINFNDTSQEISEQTGNFSKAFGDLPEGGKGIITTKRNQDFAKKMSTTLKGSYITAENAGEIQSTITKESRKAFIKKTQSTDSQAIRQSILYVVFAGMLLLWLSYVEILGRYIWLKKIKLRQGKHDVA
jgi:hypothetical protein